MMVVSPVPYIVGRESESVAGVLVGPLSLLSVGEAVSALAPVDDVGVDASVD